MDLPGWGDNGSLTPEMSRWVEPYQDKSAGNTQILSSSQRLVLKRTTGRISESFYFQQNLTLKKLTNSYYDYWSFLYSAILCSQAIIVFMSDVILNEWLPTFIARFLIHWSGVLTALFGCYVAGIMWNCCLFGAHSVYTIQPCNCLQYHLFSVTYVGCLCVQLYHPATCTFGRMTKIFYMILQ